MSKDIETYIEELKDITEKLESGDLKLQEAVELYKRGTTTAAAAEKLLDALEQEIEVVEIPQEEEQ